MSRRVTSVSLFLGIMFCAPVATAAGAKHYLHASTCHEVGPGPSGSMDRDGNRVTNNGAATQQLICHVPKTEDPGESGTNMEVKVVVDDTSSGYVYVYFERRSSTGTVLSWDQDVTAGQAGVVTLTVDTAWAASSTYTLVVSLPANGAPGSGVYTRFHSYTVQRI